MLLNTTMRKIDVRKRLIQIMIKKIAKYQDSKTLSETISDKKKAKNAVKGEAVKNIQTFFTGKIRLESRIIDKAFNKNIISVEVRPAYIGRKRQIDIDIVDTFLQGVI